MINVLIVDDEYTIREGIKNTFKWDEYGLKVCGTASSGYEALELIEKYTPEIVILDIKLMDIDGLEVLEVIREKYSNIKVILISGYDEFEYAQKAIELNAFSYILKPIDDKKLFSKILEAKNIIEDQFNKIRSDENLKKQLKDNIPILRDIFLNQIASGKLSDENIIKDKAKFLGIELDMPQYAALVLELQNYKNDGEISEYDKSMLKLAVENSLKNMFQCMFKYYSFNIDNNIGVLIQGNEINRKLLVKKCTELKDHVNKSIGLMLTIGLGKIHEGIKGISLAFREALNALEYKILLGNNVIIDIENINTNEKNLLIGNIFEDTINKMENDLIYSLKIFDREKVWQITHKIIVALEETLRANIEESEHLIFLLSFFITRILFALNIRIEDFFNHGNEIFDDLKNLQTINQFEEYLNRLFERVICELQNRQNSNNSFLIKKAIEYISRNIYNDISLTKTADALYISPNYLSRVFKQEMNETFIEYVTTVKMNEAKKLLKNSNYKIYEIADMLKYKDVNHFTKVFKKVFGVTPMEYRELAD